ncbi:RDD family protein [Streptomyces griseus]|uniref:RDD family protein n=1 Tax=Streptomyces stephensoniae TaxID=3375367 RepID=A0ABU2W4N1_9ACTN|nr:RDD family protein [Streptomyces griseus]MDT0492087.1 RDD family protein [Streptomyces griseus]
MSAPTPAPGDESPREGYYPDPSIPGYVRYWNGASWVPGTSRPAPQQAAPAPSAAPAPQAGPRPAPVEETGPIFFDEEEAGPTEGPDSGAGGSDRPADGPGEPAAGSVWQADSARQTGFGGERDRRVSWGGGPAPEPASPGARPPLAQDPTGGALPGMRDGGGGGRTPEEAGARPPTEGTVTIRAVGPRADARGSAPQPGAVQPNAPQPDAVQPNPVRPDAAQLNAVQPNPVQPNAGTPQGPQNVSAAQRPVLAPAPEPRPLPAQAQQMAPAPQEARQGPVRAPETPAAPTPVPPAALHTPLTPGPGGGSASWAQQVHQLAQPEAQQQPHQPHQQQALQQQPQHQTPQQHQAPQQHQQQPVPHPHPLPSQQQQPPFAQSGTAAADQPVVPWKPPAADDPFQQLVRSQTSARPAGLGKRFAARLVDTLVLGAVVGAVAVPLATRALDHIDRKITAAKQTGETVTVWLLDSTTGALLGALLAAFLLLGFLLEALPTAKWGRTLGKKLLGLDVRDIESHETPTLGAALRRWLVYGVLGLLVIGVVNVFWCLVDRPWRQCWHDKAARTFVAG